MSELILIRHGETSMAGTFCGHSDPPLNDRGRKQAAEVAALLAGVPLATIYSSDLKRARQTAKVLCAARATEVRSTPALREIDFGRWEGLRWSQVEAHDAAYAVRWMAEFPALPAPDGEDLAAFQTRVLACVRAAMDDTPRPVAIVSHGGVMRVVLEQIFGYPQAEAWAKAKDYGSVVRLRLENRSVCDAVTAGTGAGPRRLPQVAASSAPVG